MVVTGAGCQDVLIGHNWSMSLLVLVSASPEVLTRRCPDGARRIFCPQNGIKPIFQCRVLLQDIFPEWSSVCFYE